MPPSQHRVHDESQDDDYNDNDFTDSDDVCCCCAQRTVFSFMFFNVIGQYVFSEWHIIQCVKQQQSSCEDDSSLLTLTILLSTFLFNHCTSVDLPYASNCQNTMFDALTVVVGASLLWPVDRTRSSTSLWASRPCCDPCSTL